MGVRLSAFALALVVKWDFFSLRDTATVSFEVVVVHYDDMEVKTTVDMEYCVTGQPGSTVSATLNGKVYQLCLVPASGQTSFKAISDSVETSEGVVIRPFSAASAGGGIGGGGAMSVDSYPQAGSDNPVSSGGVYLALQSLQKALVLNNETETDDVTGVAYLSDGAVSSVFSAAMMGDNRVNEVLGIEIPVWDDLSNSNSSPTVTVDSVAYNIHAPWRQTMITSPETFIKKLADNAGKRGLWHEQGITSVSEVDDYETHPAFIYLRCLYVCDSRGNKRPVAIEGSSVYESLLATGTYSVGVLRPRGYFRDVVEVSTDYGRTIYAAHFEAYGGVKVRRRYWSASAFEGSQPWCQCVREDGAVAPYFIHDPSLLSLGPDGKRHCLPGYLISNNLSYNTLYNEYENQNSSRYQGPGYHGGEFATIAYAQLMLQIKHGVKSSQSIATGISNFVNRWCAEPRSTTGKTFPLTTADASTLDVGQYVGLRLQGTLTDYNVTTGLSGSAAGQFDSSASSYHAGVQSVKVLAKVPRNDGSGIVDVELDVPEDGHFALPQNTVSRRAYQNEAGTLLGYNYSTSYAIKYKENPLYDSAAGKGEDSKYVPANNLNANTLHTYLTNGTNSTTLYKYVPDLAEYQGVSRCYMQQGYPRSCSCDGIYGHRDGTIGRARTNMSAWRIQGLEFGCGLFELVMDMVICAEDVGGTVMNVVRMPKKNHKRYNSFANFKSYYVDCGRKLTWSAWFSELDYSPHGSTQNVGTADAPGYVNTCYFPSGTVVNKAVGSESIAYGDYHWAANSVNNAYEVFVGGNAGNGTGCGLACLYAGNGLGNAGWDIAGRG